MPDNISDRAGRGRPLLHEMVDQYLRTSEQLTRRAARRRSYGRQQVGPLMRAPLEAADGLMEKISRPDRRMPSRFPAPEPWVDGGLRPNRDDIRAAARNAFRMYKMHLDRGHSPADAAGWAANGEDESGNNFKAVEVLDTPRPDGRVGQGLYQLTEPSRVAAFEREIRVPVQNSSEEQQLRFRDWEMTENPAFANVRRHVAEAQTAGDIADVIAREYLIPDRASRRAVDRRNIANEILALQRQSGPWRQPRRR